MAVDLPKAFVLRTFEPIPGTTGPAVEVFLLLTDETEAKELGSFLNEAKAGRAASNYDKSRIRPQLSSISHKSLVTYAGTPTRPLRVERMQVGDERTVRVTECSLDELPADVSAQVVAALQNAEIQDATANIGPDVEPSTACLPRTSLPRNIEVVNKPGIPRPGRGLR